MKIEWAAAISFLSIFLVLAGVSHFLYKKAGYSSEASRKFLHVTGGVLSMFAVLFFRSHWTVLVICSGAFLFLLITFISKWLPAVHKTERNSVGSVIFPVPVYMCFLAAKILSNDLYFLLPVSLLTISDTVAEIAGKRWGIKTKTFFNRQKTLAGSLGFFFSSIIISVCWAFVFDLQLTNAIVLIFTTSFFSTCAELVSTKGYDNLFIPFTALVFTYLSLLS